VTIGLSLFLNRTIVGKALRASAINLNGAELVALISRNSGFSVLDLQAPWRPDRIVITPITFTGYEIGILTD